MFLVQPANGFGHLICRELASEQLGRRRWHAVEFAVAWANYSGLNSVFDSIREFLSEGGLMHVTVGLDFGSTSYEGLCRLLELEQEGDLTTHVFFDENPACTFHPKVVDFHPNLTRHFHSNLIHPYFAFEGLRCG